MLRAHDDYDWITFAEQAALAFWADAYMDEVQNLAEEGYRKAYEALSPGPGGEWLDVIPETPESALDDGRAFTAKLQGKLSVADLREVSEKMSPEKAGWYAAMGAMGHGVGWWDYDVDIDVGHWTPSVDVQYNAYHAVRYELREQGIRLTKAKKRR